MGGELDGPQGLDVVRDRDPLVPDILRTRRLIAAGNTKAAIALAKEILRKKDDEASRGIVKEAYAARIADLKRRGLEAEASALLATVVGRFGRVDLAPSPDRNDAAGAARKAIDALVAPLADEALPPERRRTILSALRRELLNPALLAESDALGDGHPLKVEAKLVLEAFAIVTSARVSDEAVALPQVSSKSPFAPWKLLVRSIAAYYRGEDDLCLRFLQAIDPESVPARAKEVLRVALSRVPAAGLSHRSEMLLSRVSPSRVPFTARPSRNQQGTVCRSRSLQSVRRKIVWLGRAVMRREA